MSDDHPLWPLVRAFATISVLAVGGANAAAPEIRRVAVERNGWMDAGTFSHLFGIAQAAPGPNVLLVSLVGWQVSGWSGLLAATLAVLVPSSVLALIVGRLVVRSQRATWFKVAQDALVPIALGLILASGVVMAGAAGTSLALILVSAGSAAFVLLSNRNPLWTIAVGASGSIALHIVGLG